MNDLKKILEDLYLKYNHQEFIPPDPLQFVYKYNRKKDREVAAFFSSAMAYGRVEQIEKSLIKLFGLMGNSPYDFILDFNSASIKKFNGFKHRFNDENDIINLIKILQKSFRQDGSLENLFKKGYSGNDDNILSALEIFINNLRSFHKGQISRGLNYLLCKPSAGSPCKRLNLFLRWMIRNDQVDPGLWKDVSPSKLIMPIDVHIGRLTGFLNMHTKKNISLATAVEITNHFALLNPSDPVKYDFALSRIGILENCSGVYGDKCKGCSLVKYCQGNI